MVGSYNICVWSKPWSNQRLKMRKSKSKTKTPSIGAVEVEDLVGTVQWSKELDLYRVVETIGRLGEVGRLRVVGEIGGFREAGGCVG